jgi:hypothetical protein
MLANLEIQLSTLTGDRIFAGSGRNTALEVNGDLDQLLSMK